MKDRYSYKKRVFKFALKVHRQKLQKKQPGGVHFDYIVLHIERRLNKDSLLRSLIFSVFVGWDVYHFV